MPAFPTVKKKKKVILVIFKYSILYNFMSVFYPFTHKLIVVKNINSNLNYILLAGSFSNKI